MVGRTPEYLGKKIQAPEMKLVVLYLLAMPLVLLAFAAASVVLDSAAATIYNPGAHGLSEVLYNFASAANNNGSAFAGQGTGTDWYTVTQGLAMLIGRFFLIIPALAIGGSLVRKQRVPVTAGTFPTDSPLFGGLVAGAISSSPASRSSPPSPSARSSSTCRCEVHELMTATLTLRPTPVPTPTDRPPKVRRRPPASRSLFDPAIVKRAALDSLRQARPAHARHATR